MKKVFSISLLVCCLLIFSFLKGVSYSVPFISEETELSMGKGADKEITDVYGIYPDKSLQIYVDQIGQRLVSQLSDKVFSRYFFKVVDSSQIKSFALPGGYVYVTRGILGILNSEAELAGVMGHEIGHVILHHGAKSIIRSIGATILSLGAAIANPQNAGQWLLVSTQLFQQVNLGYGREAELESDAQGMMNSFETGYNPQGVVNFLKTLRRQEIFSGQSYHSFQASHPETKERIITAEALSSSLKSRNSSAIKLENRDLYLSHLQGLPFGGKRGVKDRKMYKDQFIDIYKVNEGDTFKSIAVKELSDPKRDLEIAVLNGRRETDTLAAGYLLKLVKDGKYDENKTLKLAPYNKP